MNRLTFFIFEKIDEALAHSIAAQLAATPLASVSVEINSPGGDLSAALAIANALTAHKGRVTIKVVGVCASAATLLCCCGAPVEAADNSIFMIHAPWVETAGNAEKLRSNAVALDKHAQAMALLYARKIHLPPDQFFADFLDGADHWLTAAEAQTLGLVDTLTGQSRPLAQFSFGSLTPPGKIMNEHSTPAVSATATPAISATAHEIATACMASDAPELIAGLSEKPVTMAQVQAKIAYVRTIKSLAAGLHLEEMAPDLIQAGVTPDGAKKILWTMDVIRTEAAPIKNTRPIGSSVSSFGGYGESHFASAARSALAVRMGIPHNPHPGAQDLKGMSMATMAETMLNQTGRTARGRGASDVIQAAMTTSDFPNLLSGTANFALVKRFEMVALEHRAFVSQGSLRDFKPGRAINLSFIPGLELKKESGEIAYGSLTDGAEPIQLATFARGLSFSREAMINDDLGGLDRAIQAAANAAARTERDLIFGLLATNPAMSDSIALFHANHGNIGSGALSAAALGLARTAMRKQRDSSGGYVTTVPKFIVCPVELETTAESIIAALSYRTDLAGPETTAPSWQNRLQVIADPRLDAASTSVWYLFSDPMTAPVIELDFLDGNTSPVVEQDTDFDRDMIRFKVRFDVGVAAVGYAGAVKMA